MKHFDKVQSQFVITITKIAGTEQACLPLTGTRIYLLLYLICVNIICTIYALVFMYINVAVGHPDSHPRCHL